jgi:hypothetical protein
LASAIICRHGGDSTTSGLEALHRFHRGSSTPPCHKVVHLRWLRGGKRHWIFIRRGLSSKVPLILGGDAWSTPTICGKGTQGLDCISILSSRVLFVKWKALSSNSWSLRECCEGLSK